MSINFDNSIVICDQAYFNIFYSSKEKDPFLDIKLMDKKEVVSLLEFEVNNEFIKYLLLNIEDLDYLNAKKLAYILQYADESKYKYKEELLNKGIIKKEELNEEIFKRKNIFLFEESEDKELTSLLKRHNLNFKLINFSDLDYQKNLSFKDKVYRFKNYDEEFSYLFSYINKLLIEDKVDPSKIYVYFDSTEPFFINYYASIYNIETNFKYYKPVKTDPLVTKELKRFYNNKKIDTEFEIKNENLEKLKSAIIDFDLINLDFDRAFIILEEYLNALKLYKVSNNKGINIVNKPIFKKDIYLFTLSFDASSFYKVYKNDNYLLDNELEKIEVNKSYTKTMMNKKLMENFLLYQNHIFLGKVKEHLQEKLHDSEFISLYNIEYKEPKIDSEFNLYNKKSLELIEAKYKDKYFFKSDDKYRSYDNSFKKFKFKTDKVSFSASSLEKYAKCPFSYYLARVLLKNKGKKEFVSSLGNFVHLVYQNVVEKEVDIKSCFEELLSKDKDLSEKEKLVIDLTLKDLIVVSIEKFNEWFFKIKEVYPNVTLKREDSETNALLDDNNIKGRIDLLIDLDEKKEIIIDYKSGSVDKKIDETNYGLNFQLPFYYFLSKGVDENKDVIGLFYYRFLEKLDDKNNLIDSKEIYKEKAFKLVGESNFKEKDKLDFLLGKKKDNKKESDKDLDLENENEFKEFINNSKKYIDEAIKNINNLDFKILPAKLDENSYLPCKYCAYSSICYKKDEVRIVKGEEDE